MRCVFSMLTACSIVLAGCGTETEDWKPVLTDTEPNASESSDSQAETFALTADNTQVLFTGVKKSGDSHSGDFKAISGQITLADHGIDAINVVIGTFSLVADVDKLTGHLKSEDFFSVAEFPELKFESTKIDGDGDVTVTGNLTMHGQTNEISFPAAVSVAEGNVTLSSEFKVDRTKFGMNYTGQPDDPINAEVDIKIIVGERGDETGTATSSEE